MRWWVVIGVTAVLSAIVGLGASRAVVAPRAEPDCIEDPLGQAEDYSVVLLEDFVDASADVEGKMVLGRDLLVANGSMGLGTRVPLTSPPALIVAAGRDMRLSNNTGVNTGNMTFGGTLQPANFDPPGDLTVTKAALPFNIQALFDGLVIRSTSWAGLEPNGTSSYDGYALRLTGTNRTRNVFAPTAQQLDEGRALYLKVPDGSTALINIPAGSFTNRFEGGIFVWDSVANQFVQPSVPCAGNPAVEALRRATVWNYPNASSITFGPPDTQWFGTILAPRAVVTFHGNQHIAGTVIALTKTGFGEFGFNPPTGACLPPPTPCPS